jgi:hypothetical protein
VVVVVAGGHGGGGGCGGDGLVVVAVAMVAEVRRQRTTTAGRWAHGALLVDLFNYSFSKFFVESCSLQLSTNRLTAKVSCVLYSL